MGTAVVGHLALSQDEDDSASSDAVHTGEEAALTASDTPSSVRSMGLHARRKLPAFPANASETAPTIQMVFFMGYSISHRVRPHPTPSGRPARGLSPRVRDRRTLPH